MIGLNITILREGEDAVTIRPRWYFEGETPGEKERLRLTTDNLGKTGCMIKAAMLQRCEEMDSIPPTPPA